MIAITAERKDSFHWLINLPTSFEQYLSSLGTKTRKTTTRSIRKFEQEFRYEFIVVSRPDQVDDFLQEGESISRSTYQWHIGQRLNNDETTRNRYAALAKAGQLRCYLLKIDGEPAAFARGQLEGKFFYYETPGFLPKYEKLSPGTILFMWTVRDLIENTDCTVFDFGTGHGDYKSRFGNASLKCTSIDVARAFSPYSLFLIALQKMLSFAKNLADAFIDDSHLRQRIKKAIRKTSG
jgi:CelD/BcsL family acetyltransferase involved in cellulose biosynthesis